MVAPIPLLRSETLTAAGFAHGFTTRIGGVSARPFDTLDFALLRDPASLAENQRRLAQSVGFDPAGLYQTRQVHGDRVVFVDGATPTDVVSHEEADALVARTAVAPRGTSVAGARLAVAVRVADCVPILIADGSGTSVAAVHAGWRGVVNHVVRAAISALEGEPRELLCAIGPSIGGCCFEVDDAVADAIAGASSADAIAARTRPGKVLVDLRRAVRAQLRDLGVPEEAIDDPAGSDACTRCDRERFYSYRRDGDASGRLVAVICPRESS